MVVFHERPLQFVCRIVVFLKSVLAAVCMYVCKFAFFEVSSFHYALHSTLEGDTGSDFRDEIRCVCITLQ